MDTFNMRKKSLDSVYVAATLLKSSRARFVNYSYTVAAGNSVLHCALDRLPVRSFWSDLHVEQAALAYS